MPNVLHIDDYDTKDAMSLVAAFGNDRYGYLVTPNTDHLISYSEDAEFRALYAQASYVFLDSRFLSQTIGLVKGQSFSVCPGSDLTAGVLGSVLKPRDVTVLVGGTPAQAQCLRSAYGLQSLHHVDPPMNFIRDPAAVEACLRAIETSSPFRFCFLAIGSPQQEIVARKLKERGSARGLALCVGASINFLTGVEKRAPRWMQRAGFEWIYRLSKNPRRLWKRYLIRGPKIFRLLPQIELRARRSATGLAPAGLSIRPKTVPIRTSPGQTV
jgi:N-acetylglucosaminyldiphosphoundecaprenol N-acetyl-beta-D-mannosaminyltransferase